jgi:ribosomal protein L35
MSRRTQKRKRHLRGTDTVADVEVKRITRLLAGNSY